MKKRSLYFLLGLLVVVALGASVTTMDQIVVAAFKMTGGSPGSGKVLTSDASGNGSWVAASGEIAVDTTQLGAGGGNGTNIISGAKMTNIVIQSSGGGVQFYPNSSLKINIMQGDTNTSIISVTNFNFANGLLFNLSGAEDVPATTANMRLQGNSYLGGTADVTNGLTARSTLNVSGLIAGTNQLALTNTSAALQRTLIDGGTLAVTNGNALLWTSIQGGNATNSGYLCATQLLLAPYDVGFFRLGSDTIRAANAAGTIKSLDGRNILFLAGFFTNQLDTQGTLAVGSTADITNTLTARGALNVTGIVNATSAVVAQATMSVNSNNVARSTNDFSVSHTVAPGQDESAFCVNSNAYFRGRMYGGSGSAGLPSFSFLADPTTGIYQSSGGIISFAASGARYLQIDSSGLVARNTAVSVALPSGGGYGFSSSASDASSGIDAKLGRAAAGVLEVNNGTLGTQRWIQWNGLAQLATNMTTVSTTLANVGLNSAINLLAGRSYEFTCVIFFNEGTTAVDGIKLDFGGSAATATTFRAHGNAYGATSGFGGHVTSLTGTIAGAAVSTDDEELEIHGFIKCNAAGTFIPRFAKNADAVGGTLTIYAGSNIIMHDLP